ncbi:allergen [Paraphaeosphaeria sporulosa]
MDKAKAAVSDFMSKAGHHDTTVHETVAPAVVEEVVKPHVHEEVNTAIDKEVHQDHYHRTVQPIKDREVLPEKHTAQLGAVQHREFDHRDHDHTKRNLAAEQAQFKDQRVVTETSHSQSANAAIGGEHVHHHIHETIQPVVHKETIQPSVVHTTVPIHEVHHNAATIHESSELPAMTMSEFKQKGGVLSGRDERYDGFEGEPKHIGGTLKHMMEGKTSKRDSHQDHEVRESAMHGDFDPLDGGKHNTAAGRLGGAGTGVGAAGVGAGSLASGRDYQSQSQTGNIRGVEEHHIRKSDGLYTGDKLGRETSSVSSTSHSTGTQPKKASLLDKLNPLKDADGDGKKGLTK